jgi:hypothetical protein
LGKEKDGSPGKINQTVFQRQNKNQRTGDIALVAEQPRGLGFNTQYHQKQRFQRDGLIRDGKVYEF